MLDTVEFPTLQHADSPHDEGRILHLDKSAFNDVYIPLLNCRKRYVHLYGGAGSGKSDFAASLVVIDLLVKKPCKYLIARKVGKTIRNSCFALVIEIIRRWNLSDLFQVIPSRLEILCKPTGSSLICSGIDDPEKLKSIHGITDVWIEEATEITEEDFDQLDLRLRGNFASYFRMLITYNPIFFYHWLKRVFHDRSYTTASDGRGQISGDTVLLKTTYRDNRFIDAAYSETTLKRLAEKSPRVAQIYDAGDWAEPENLVYSNWQVVSDASIATPAFYGLDFGYNSPSCLVAGCFHTETELHVREIFYETGLLTRDIIARLRDAGVNPRTPIYCDSANPDKIEELLRAGYAATAANKNIQEGIGFLQGFDIRIGENSINGIKELSLYEYEKRNGQITETPIKTSDHFCDAMRYGVYTYAKIFGVVKRDAKIISVKRNRSNHRNV